MAIWRGRQTCRRIAIFRGNATASLWTAAPISHRRSHGSFRRSVAMRPTLFKKQSVWLTNTRGFKRPRLHFISVRNTYIFRTPLPLCISSSLAGIEGGSNQIAGSNVQVASQTRPFPLNNGKW